jgi:hypothetical protein
MTRTIRAERALDWQVTISCAVLVAATIALGACAQKKKYSWADRLPAAGCNPRTAQAKAELGGCPKLADPQRPTLQEEREFVGYMNKKDAIEGTEMDGTVLPPGCYKWDIEYGQVHSKRVSSDPKCLGPNLEKKLRTFKLPSGG